ncbi:MAG: hypothetical protein LBE31_03655 [Deltaproteobacteria bacterium]|nr:hypothetical protein [Deltaproteobacteria bacterium]
MSQNFDSPLLSSLDLSLEPGPLKPWLEYEGDWRGNLFDLPLSDLKALPLSIGRSNELIAESIESFGLLYPLWVAKSHNNEPIVISGGLRLSALRLLGHKTAPCLAPPGPNFLTTALISNLSRGLNPAEMAVIWLWAKKLAAYNCDNDSKNNSELNSDLNGQSKSALNSKNNSELNSGKDSEKQEVQNLLGLKPGDRRLSWLEAAAALPKEALLALALGRLDLENAPELMALSSPERDIALSLILGTKASRQNRRQWLGWLGDLKRINNAPLDSFLTKNIVSDLTSAEGGEKKTHDYLQKLRFPFVSELRDRRQKFIDSLNLPNGLKLTLDNQLEDEKYDLYISFSDAGDLKRLVEAALELAQGDNLKDILELSHPLVPQG